MFLSLALEYCQTLSAYNSTFSGPLLYPTSIQNPPTIKENPLSSLRHAIERVSLEEAFVLQDIAFNKF